MMACGGCTPPAGQVGSEVQERGVQWVADKAMKACSACGLKFGALIWRHHCRFCGQVFCRYCTQDRWALPKLEYLRPVRVCGKCSRLCWKAEAMVQAIRHNDVSAVAKYISLKSDCMLHTGVYPPLTTAASAGTPEICRLLLSGLCSQKSFYVSLQ